MIREAPSVQARALSGMVTNEKGIVTARVNFEILEGPDAGQRITYNGQVTQKSAPYVAKDLAAVGWKGRSLSTLTADVEKSSASTTIEIQHKQTKDGSRTFPVVRSIGRPPREVKPASTDDITNADMMLSAALGTDDERDAPPVDDSDIPF